MASADRLIDVFNEAKARPTEAERQRFVAEACADDPELKQQVLSLLQAHDGAANFLQPAPLHPSTVLITEKPGDRIGRYKLLQQIGEGGCGVVYMAEQEEPVRRRVALKVIKLGMDTKQVIARFEAERQALALMDHPNIAKVFDAGTTDTGRPYFVMELVRGIKITDYCDENNLPMEERLKLFTQVCQAIQHAHQKGIIHRDIKPSNILVTVSEPGASGSPKVIDFGIAKATTGERLTDKTVFTAFEQFIGTPAYMSPEQAMMTALDIDTRTDIYALGVLLYELLTGRTPFDAQDLMAAGLDAMRRIIREQEPVRPSTRLSTMLAADLTIVAKQRNAEPARLGPLLRGDLDWIVMKALEKDRARRYETANGFARDIQRHLNCEPVLACPPSRVYEFQKTVRRHKFGFAAAAALITVLAAGAVVSTWQAIRATRAEREQSRLRQAAQTEQANEAKLRREAEADKQKAVTEAAKATAISDFLQQMLSSANPDALKGSEYTVRQLLDDLSAGLGTQLAGQPEVEATVQATIGNTYFRLGAIDKAEPHLERALALRRRIYGEQSEEVAQSLVDHAWNLSQQTGGKPEAEAEARRALDIYRRRAADAQPVIHALCALGVILNFEVRFQEMETVSEEALALARKSPERDFPDMANILHNLASAEVHLGKYVEAEHLALESVEMHRRLHGPDHPETAWSLFMLGRALYGQHKLAEAERAYRESLGIFRKRYSLDHVSVQLAVSELGTVLEAEGDCGGAEALCHEFLADQRAALGNDSPAVAETLGNLGASLYAHGKQAEAEKALREALEILLNLRDQDRAKLPPVVQQLADILKSQGKSQGSEKLFEDVIKGAHQKLGETNLILGELLHDYAGFLEGENKWEASVEQYLKSLPIRRVNQDDGLAWTLRNLGGDLILIGKPQEAEAYLRESLVLFRKLHQQEDITGTVWVTERLGYALYQQRRLPEAEQTYRDALGACAKCQALGSDEYSVVVQSLLDVLKAENKLAEFEVLCRETLAQQRAAFTNDSPLVLQTLSSLTGNLISQGKHTEAGTTALEAAQKCHTALAQYEKLASDSNRNHDCWSFAISYEALGDILKEIGQTQDAEKAYRDTQVLWRKLVAGFNTEDNCFHLAVNDDALGNLLRENGRATESLEVYREAQAIWLKSAADLNSEDRRAHLGWTDEALGQLLTEAGRSDEAIEVYQQALAVWKKLEADFHKKDTIDQEAFITARLAGLLRGQGKDAEAGTLERDLAERGNTAALNELSWRLATAADAKLRDGSNAVSYAERAVAQTDRKHVGILDTLAAAYAETRQFEKAISVQKEALALSQSESEKIDLASRLRLYEAGIPYRDHGALAEKAKALLEAGKYAEAEPVARECLTIRETEIPDDWRTFNSRSVLGCALLGEKKYTDAEPLLLAGYEGMKQREDKIPAAGKLRVKETLQRLVQLYEASGQSKQAAEWNKKLAEFDQVEAEKKNAVSKPQVSKSSGG